MSPSTVFVSVKDRPIANMLVRRSGKVHIRDLNSVIRITDNAVLL